MIYNKTKTKNSNYYSDKTSSQNGTHKLREPMQNLQLQLERFIDYICGIMVIDYIRGIMVIDYIVV